MFFLLLDYWDLITKLWLARLYEVEHLLEGTKLTFLKSSLHRLPIIFASFGKIASIEFFSTTKNYQVMVK